MRPVRLHYCNALVGDPSGSPRRSCAPAELRRSQPGRAGATLTEVLMAILIMAIGIVSVFTLFPISVLRTIQATQQTNSKIHKLNAQELVKTSPGVLTAFEIGTTIGRPSLPPPLPPLGPLRYRGQWQPQTAYAVDDVVVPTLKAGQLFPTPFVLYRAVPTTPPTGTSATDEPVWQPQSPPVVTDGGVDWAPILDGAGIPVSYVVDPLGYHIAVADQTSPPGRFGNKTDPATGTGITPADESLLRIHGGITSSVSVADAIAVATARVAQPDNWEEVVSGTPVSATNTTVDFPPTISIPTISLPAATSVLHRIVLTSTDGQMTTYRTISTITPPTVNLSEAIPARFPRDAGGNPDIGTARIESQTRRFSWFLTVRNSAAGDPDIKCVVVFNRNFASASEHVYDANFGDVFDRVDVDNFGGPDATQHGLTGSSNWVKIVWPDTEPQPLLKPGNWLFDARDVTWYRVQEVFDQGKAGGLNFAILFLDRSVRKQSRPAPAPTGQAILMPGIVEVFNM